MQLEARAQWRVAVHSLNGKLKTENIPLNPKMERQVERKQIPAYVVSRHSHTLLKPRTLTHQTGYKLYALVKSSLVLVLLGVDFGSPPKTDVSYITEGLKMKLSLLPKV